ncbi:MAG TPA: hypothetical protein ENK74_04105, partial [Nitratifractor sp.]|nr:hypothetical protein [Nitratifractor sp.]
MKAIYLLAIVSMLFLSGCDIFDTHQTKKAAVTNFEENISFKKRLTLKEANASIPIEAKEGLDYLQIVQGLDSNLFTLSGNS